MPPKRATNNREIRPIPLPADSGKPFSGMNIVPDRYCNIFMIAQKKSGKTTAINHMVKQIMDREHDITIFCPTYEQDHTYLDLDRHLKSHSYPHKHYYDIVETGEVKGINHIKQFIDGCIARNKVESDSDSDDDDGYRVGKLSLDTGLFSSRCCELFPVDKIEKKKKEKEKDHLLLFDDLGEACRSREMTQLLKTSRHHKSKVIISSQWLNDITPAGLRQIDHLYLFPGLPEAKLVEVYRKISMKNMTFDQFKSLYDRATHEPFNFLNIDIRRQVYKQCFNQIIE